MLTASKWLLLIGSVLLIADSIMIFSGISNPLFGLSLPCPVTLLLLGLGILLFAIGSKAFKKE